MKQRTCTECGHWDGHHQNCPELPEPREPFRERGQCRCCGMFEECTSEPAGLICEHCQPIFP